MDDNTSLRVLLVDDDARYLELVEMMLEGEEFTVTSETDGENLIDHVARHQPDVIVMDIMLQQRNGIELAHELRITGNCAQIPIVFVSAWTGKNELKLPRKSMRLFKPFTQSEIIAALRTVLGATSVAGDMNE